MTSRKNKFERYGEIGTSTVSCNTAVCSCAKDGNMFYDCLRFKIFKFLLEAGECDFGEKDEGRLPVALSLLVLVLSR